MVEAIAHRTKDSTDTILHSATGLIAETARSFPLLSHGETVAEFEKIEQGDVALLLLLLFINELDESQVPQLEKIILESKAAKEKLLLSNMRWVLSIANNYLSSGTPIEDLFQQGMLGLMTAINKFDSDKEYKFTTYATFWIRQAMTRYIYHEDIIKVAFHAQIFLNQVNQGVVEYDELTTHQQKFVAQAQVARKVESFHQPLSTGELLGETISGDQDTPKTALKQENLLELQSIFEKVLTAREEMVLKLLHGLGKATTSTPNEIAAALDISRQHVHKIKSTAYQKLLHFFHSKNITIYEDFLTQ